MSEIPEKFRAVIAAAEAVINPLTVAGNSG